MIHTKEDLKLYLKADLERIGKRPGLKDYIIRNESWFIWVFMYCLRHLEYHKNRNNKIRYCFYFFLYKRLSWKLHFTVYPNTLGPGARFFHVGSFIHIGPNVHIGKNSTILPGVVFGNKTQTMKNQPVEVGDNCYFGLSAKIFGPLTIGNNVVVGANAVVTKDIPDNCVVGGVPAKIIRRTI